MIIVTGSLAYDYIMEFPGEFGDHILPEHTHNINLSFMVNKFAKHRGGTAGNVSYTLGLLKTPQILFSIAGSDFDEYKKTFENMGIDTSKVAIVKSDSTATGFAMADRASNQIWGFYNGASVNTSLLHLDKIAKKEDFVYIGPQGVGGSIDLIKQSIKLDLPYMFDPGFILTQITDDELSLGIAHADYVIGNEYEIELIKKRIKNYEEIIKNKIVIKTLGAKGAEIEASRKLTKIKPAKARMVQTTAGAGDAWRGGFLSGLSRNFDLETCSQMGAVAGSFAVEHFGAQEHKYTLDEFNNRYRQTYGDLIEL